VNSISETRNPLTPFSVVFTLRRHDFSHLRDLILFSTDVQSYLVL